MRFVCEPALLEHMRQKQKHVIVVEVVTSDSSDFEVTELHVYLADEKRAAFFKEKKKYKGYPMEAGEVLLPPYRLEYEDTVTFGLKSFLFFKWVTYEGMHL